MMGEFQAFIDVVAHPKKQRTHMPPILASLQAKWEESGSPLVSALQHSMADCFKRYLLIRLESGEFFFFSDGWRMHRFFSLLSSHH